MIGHGVACYGAADRYLGMLAATLGLRDRAGGHFERALELNRRMGANTWLARTSYEYGRCSSRRATAPPPSRCWPKPARSPRGWVTSLLGRVGAFAPRGRRAAGRPLGPRGGRAAARRARVVHREIGDALFISAHTAANHIRSILRKTGCGTARKRRRTRTGAASPRAELAYDPSMPVYVIERTFAEQLDLTSDDGEAHRGGQRGRGRPLAVLFLSADRRRSYMPLRAPSPTRSSPPRDARDPGGRRGRVDRVSADMYV